MAITHLDWVLLLRVLIGTFLAAVWGLERELSGKSAGLRTYALVGLGASAVMVVSQHGFADSINLSANVSFDPSRVVAQVVSGIGFLGAGLIFLDRSNVRGLTTAAGIWSAAAIGIACGAGEYALGVGITLIGFLILVVFAQIEQRLLHSKANGAVAVVTLLDRPGALGDVAHAIGGVQASILSVGLERVEGKDGLVEARFRLAGTVNVARLTDALRAVECVTAIGEVTSGNKAAAKTARGGVRA